MKPEPDEQPGQPLRPAGGDALRCARCDRDDCAVIQAVGEIDWATAPILRRALAVLLVERAPRVILDLAEVTFIDSSGLSVLIQAHHRSRKRGGRLDVAAPCATVRKLLRMTDVDRVLHVHATVEEALAAPPASDPGAGPISLGAAYSMEDWLWPGRHGADISLN